MNGMEGMPRGAAIVIDDLLDHCAEIRPGREVVLFAQVDGLYGGDAWAQPPYELVSRIRYQASTLFQEGLPFQLTADNGTHLEGSTPALLEPSP